MFETLPRGARLLALLSFLGVGLSFSTAQAQTSPKPATPAAKPSTPVTKPAVPATKPVLSTGKPRPPIARHQTRMPNRARQYYAFVWGVDSLGVKSVESGELIRFTYRVLDPEKAKALNDKKNEPSLIDPKAGVKLVVPSLEKVGQLRQSSTPIAGKVYWMAFSNKGRPVKPGDRVNVVIGAFRADGLVVQ